MMPARPIALPELSLVALVGASGSGKSTFARAHFLDSEIVSSDRCRELVADDENDQAATAAAFDVLKTIVGKRLEYGRLAVVDATSVQAPARKMLLELAKRYHVPAVAIVFDLPEGICHERNASRPNRQFGPHVVRHQSRDLRRSLGTLRREGFQKVFVFDDVASLEHVTFTREPLRANRRTERGGFDIVGDIHGCFDELLTLLERLGYRVARGDDGRYLVTTPQGRRAVFLGDLVDRGPRVPDVLALVMDMVESGAAFCVPGNHENKLLRSLSGRSVTVSHGLAESLEQLAREPAAFTERVKTFIDGLPGHLVLDDGKLVVAHAGMKETMQGRSSGAVRSFALYGETTGETDEFGLPVRFDWASEYRGGAAVVYGHTPVPQAQWLNNTICVDTGCVYGGNLTALRWPERELCSVPAARVYCEPTRPLAPPESPDVPSSATLQQRHDDLLDLADVSGRRLIRSRFGPNVMLSEEQSAAALEVMGRFAMDPRLLPYLPPTMSPPEPSARPDLLEGPEEAFAYYDGHDVEDVICEEKHMGSRAVISLARDEAAFAARFGVAGRRGAVATRTGRTFFEDRSIEEALVDDLADACERAGLWETFESDWVLLDAELLPWSAKAQALLRTQYAATGAAALGTLRVERDAFARAAARGLDVGGLLERTTQRLDDAGRFVAAYRRYCWSVESVRDLRVAPFAVLATEGRTWSAVPHERHLAIAERLAEATPLVRRTESRAVSLGDPASVASGIAWWESITAAGGEGMVVKPAANYVRAERGVVQPGVKVRGREYLRIIYGPDYDRPDQLQRLKQRSVGKKRRLAAQEYGLGLEALERFVAREPLRRTHECVFAVLALETDPIDPRL